MTNNITTGATLKSAEIAVRDMALRVEDEKKRLARMTPAQIERERLLFQNKRRAAIAEYYATKPRNLAPATQLH